METWPIVLISVIVLIIVLVTLINLAKKSKKLNDKKTDISSELEPIYQALGLDNIKSVSKIQDRIRLEINDKDLIDVKTLQTLGIMATIKGLELTILYRKNSDQLFNYLKEKIKWDKEKLED